MKATWRHNVLFAVLILGLGLLAARLVTLMLADQAKVAARAERQQRSRMLLPGRPGSIYARSGARYVPLAVSRQVPSCFADPSLIDQNEVDKVSIEVGSLLGVNAPDVQLALLERRDKRFAWLKRQISPSQEQAVAALGLRAVGIVPEWRREYPNGALAATVVGFRRDDGQPGAGIELAENDHLAAKDGLRVVLTDAARRPIWPMPQESSLPRDGANVFLCLDAVIQGYLEEAIQQSLEKFAAKWATGIVVNPSTGAILAMASTAPSPCPSSPAACSSR